ncbi:unnamed protein product [Gongylonema pulchrum]|uniref:14_3_3 domain-containing protein n=1 Tax=Gongylonema pulchrum TaxID=637853 RepID=A0A183D6W5_9BILA|nr:unnamed protein product [Gongylonema pulchrum]
MLYFYITSDAETVELESSSSSVTDGWEEDSMEAYVTPLDNDLITDVFIFYKETFEALKRDDERLFHSMTLSDPEKHAIQESMLRICEQRMSLAKSKQVEQQGGYAFDVNATVPDTFNFLAKHS